MGRLALAGLDPHTTPASQFYRSVWALLVEWSTQTPKEVAEHVSTMWAQLGGTPTVESDAPAAEDRPVAPRGAPRPGERREGRPTEEDKLAWALASAAAGTNTIGDVPTGRHGAADKVGG